MSPKISVFLLSHNKGEYVLDAMRSVFRQTRTDWELWVLENSNDGQTHKLVEAELDCWRALKGIPADKIRYERLAGEEIERTRRETYMPARLLNVYYPEAKGEYIFYLSDDDFIDDNCLEVLAGELDANLDQWVVYCGLRYGPSQGPGDLGPWPDAGIAAQDIRSFPGSVDSRIDGGQIMHRKTCLDALVWPYFEETPDSDIARHADGIFMERLVGRFMFWPVDRYLVTHRWTEHSLWSRTGVGLD